MVPDSGDDLSEDDDFNDPMEESDDIGLLLLHKEAVHAYLRMRMKIKLMIQIIHYEENVKTKMVMIMPMSLHQNQSHHRRHHPHSKTKHDIESFGKAYLFPDNNQKNKGTTYVLQSNLNNLIKHK